MAKITPMMQQYFEIKENYKHCLLFFRLGDFYEMFFEDAVIASKELEITLTGKDWGQEERAPMCGVPFHSADGYIARLVERGYKVAICEQVEDPKSVKGIVKRDIIRVVTPGTILDDGLLDITIIPDIPIWTIAKEVYKLFTGKFLTIKEVIPATCREVYILPEGESDAEPVEVDGEVVGRAPVKMEVLQQQINIIKPV